jgi:DNA-binding NtrC family response regulator
MWELESKGGTIAKSDVPILIAGETGSGKERFTRHLHELPVCGRRLVKFLSDSTASSSIERILVDGQFPSELLYRVSAYRISMPLLRERRQEIPELFGLMLADISTGDAAVPYAGPGAMRALMEYSWPGNLREL